MKSALRLVLLCTLAMALVSNFATTGWAQATRPTTPPAEGKYDKEPLRTPSRSANPAADPNDPAQKQQSSNTSELLRVVLALGIVLSVIFALKWVGRRYFMGNAAVGPSRAIQVLHRTAIAPKQQLMLIQVGRRLIVVANTGNQMNSLCEIGDADEVAELIGQIRQEKGDSITKTFSSLFKKEEDAFDVDMQKPAAAPAPVDKDIDPALADTQAELSGLMERVRTLSKQFRRS